MRSNFGQKMKAARKSRHMTQRELADKLGKNFSTIQKYENGVIEPPVSMYVEIAGALGITPIELMETAIPWPEDMQASTEARDRRSRLIFGYDNLNPTGQQIAVERVEELTKIPDYQAAKKPPEPKE